MEEEQELDRRFEAFRREFEMLREAELRCVRLLNDVPVERLTACDLESLAEVEEENATLVRMIEDGHALRMYKGDDGITRWTTPLYWICTFGKHRLFRRVLERERNNPHILHIPCDSDNDNAIQTYLCGVVDNLVSCYIRDGDAHRVLCKEDSDEVAHEISKFVCPALQTGKITVQEVNDAADVYCSEDGDELFVHTVTRAWSTRLATLWCLQVVTKANSLGDGLAEPMGRLLKHVWDHPEMMMIKRTKY